MSLEHPWHSRPFKFVVVGDRSSGKSSLIKRFTSEYSAEDAEVNFESTFACRAFTLSLSSTVKLVLQNGSTIALTSEEIEYLLRMKKCSKSRSFARNTTSSIGERRTVRWDEVFVRLHKPHWIEKPQRQHANECSGVADIEFEIWDTKGDADSTWLEWYACTGADAVLFCVPLASLLRFGKAQNNARSNAAHRGELGARKTAERCKSDKFFFPGAKRLSLQTPPVILVGTKSDQYDEATLGKDEIAVDSVGLNIAAEIGCCDFVSCSGLSSSSSVTAVFKTALANSLTSEALYRVSTDGLRIEGAGHCDTDCSVEGEVARPTYFRVHSFERKAKPGVKKDDVKEGDVDLSTPRSPPQIFFPPPPTSSPPSTLPPSSTSSIGDSDRSTSLESVMHDVQNSFDGEHDSPANSKENSKTEIPKPAPRILTNDNRNLTNSLIAAEMADSALNSSFTEASPPIPTPRRLPVSKFKRKISQAQRRESVFVKFLQT